MSTEITLEVAKDVYIRSDQPTVNFNASNLIIGKSSGSVNSIKRILVHVDLSAYIGAFISEAHLRMVSFQPTLQGAATVNRITQILWVEGTTTFNNYDTGLPWATAGLGLSDYTTVGEVSWTTPLAADPFLLEGLDDLAQDALDNRAGQLHLLLKLVDEVTTGHGVAFRDSEYTGVPGQHLTFVMSFDYGIPALPDIADPVAIYSGLDAPYVRMRIAG